MGIENGSIDLWKTARERNRLKARYLIQSRVLSRINNDGEYHPQVTGASTAASITTHGESSCSDVGGVECNNASSNINDSMHVKLEEMNIILRHLQAVVTNDTSAFSITTLARHGHLLNGPLPTPAADVSMVSKGHFKFDISKSSEASSLEEASYALSAMLSTALPWERDEPSNDSDSADDDIDSTQPTEPTQLSPSTTVESSVPPLLHHMQPTTLATSKFGPDYVTKRLVPYMQHLRLHRNRQLTFIEYASLLGRHHISQMLLLGGLDPLTTTSIGNNGNDESVDKKGERPAELASRRVLALFHSLGNPEETSKGGDNGTSSCMIPLSIWNYMIRAVIEMRMNGVLEADKGERGNLHETGRAECTLCNHEAHLLQFGPPCRHTYCEPCMWNHLVDQVPLCTDLKRNVVTCPFCAEEFGGFQCCGAQRGSRQKQDVTIEQKEQMSKVSTEISEEKKDAEDTLSMNDLSLRDIQQEESTPSIELREQRRLQSLAKYMKLPATSAELKSIKRNKRKKHRDSAHGTWGEAIRPMIQMQQSKEVRSDRFFRSVSSSPHLIIGYLDAGYDVNIQNEYGQTPLYLACWKGSVMVVQCLLDYGADVSIAANGGSSCYSVAKKYDREDVLHLLERYSGAMDDDANNATWAINRPLALTSDDDNYQVSILIDPTADHPGAGACIVDNALSEDQLQQLEKLWQSLPVADTCDDGNEKNSLNKNAKSPKSGVAMEGEQPSRLSHDTSYTSEKSTYRPSRTYFCDAEEKIQTMLEGCVQAARMALASSKNCNESSSANNPTNNAKPPSSLFQHIRFLNYEEPGGILPPHVDLCRVDDASGFRSTHTFILYLTDCPVGGGTALLKELKDPKVLAVTQPKRGRALMFRHLCPHSGLEVDSAPKLLLRGEVILDLP